MFTIKAEHKFTDTLVAERPLHLQQDRRARQHDHEAGRSGTSPARTTSSARCAAGRTSLVFNNTNILNDTTVLTLRYGWTHLGGLVRQAAVLARHRRRSGSAPNYVNALSQTDVFPELLFDDVGDVGGWGAIPNRWNSPYSINGTLSKLWGNHSLKVGADLRQLGVRHGVRHPDGRLVHLRSSASRGNNGVGGHELASVLLGAPVSGSVPYNDGPFEWFTKYYGAYVQDDWRVSSKLTLNFGVRLRTRRRPARGREPADGGLRRVGGQPARTRPCRRPACSPAGRSTAA